MTATILAVLALVGGAFFVAAGRTRPTFGGRQTRARRVAAHALQWVYLISGVMLLVRGTLGLLVDR